ncbi:MAG: Uma2 family endonuclease [Desulfitobacteriaceae bacterium]
MGQPAERKGKQYTYQDYLHWNDEERWEIVDGIVYNMTPAPSRRHQEILGELFRQFSNYLADKPCKVYIAPFDVRLPESGVTDREITTVVQPDLTVVCDPLKLDDRGCLGAPDLVIEVLSSETAKKDLTVKLDLYERTGVKEYWIVHPIDETLMIFMINENGKYGKPKTYGDFSGITVEILKEFVVDIGKVFSIK